MSYTPNVPQANQTIASTTTPIRNNFTFINTDLQVDHSFNGNSTGAEGTHLQCRMKGQASPPALLTNNNGAYYVDTSTPGNAQFWDGTNSYKMNLWRDIITGSFTANPGGTVAIGLTPGSLPAGVFGELFIYGPTSISGTISIVACSQTFWTGTVAGVVYAWSNPAPAAPDDHNPIMIDVTSVSPYGTPVDAFLVTCSAALPSSKVYNWTLVYRTK